MMRHRRLHVAAAALVLASCSSEPADTPDTAATEEPASAASTRADAEAPSDGASQDGAMLSATGYGPYRVGGQIEPEGLRESERISEDCRIFTDPDQPGLWIMTDGAGTIERVSAGSSSKLATAGGIGVGSDEAEVRAAYRGVTATPHEYVGDPGKNLYTGGEGSARMRFEIGEDGRVKQIHAGRDPFLAYAEGCA